MHYANGREVKVGDKVVGRNYQGNPISGIVTGTQDTTPGTCMMSIVPAHPSIDCLDTKQFLHVDDALPLPAPDETAAA